jgi:hypothetical protein
VANKNVYFWKAAYNDYDNNSDDDNNSDPDDEPEYNNDSNIGNDLRSDDDVLFNSEDNASDDGAANKDIDGHGYVNSGYNSDGIDIIITKDIDKYYITKLNKYR